MQVMNVVLQKQLESKFEKWQKIKQLLLNSLRPTDAYMRQ